MGSKKIKNLTSENNKEINIKKSRSYQFNELI